MQHAGIWDTFHVCYMYMYNVYYTNICALIIIYLCFTVTVIMMLTTLISILLFMAVFHSSTVSAQFCKFILVYICKAHVMFIFWE